MSVGKEKKGLAGLVGFCTVVRADITDKVVFYKGWRVSLGMLNSGRHRGSSGPSLSRYSEGTVLGWHETMTGRELGTVHTLGCRGWQKDTS